MSNTKTITIKCQIDGITLDLLCPLELSLMQCLKLPINHEKIENHIENIEAICGGNMSCSTCMVIVDPNYSSVINKMYPITGEEYLFVDMFLEQKSLTEDYEGQYRLSCQIRIVEELANLKIYMIQN